MLTFIKQRGLQDIADHIFVKLSEYFSIKIFASIGLVLYQFAFGTLPYDVASAMVALVFIDMFTGIVASKKTGAIITSRRVFETAGKLAVYGLLVSAGHLTEVIVGYDIRVDDGILVVLAFTELISILENGATLGYSIPKKLLNQLKTLRDAR
jgi:phage-related holin